MLPPLDQIHLWFAIDTDCPADLLEMYQRQYLSPDELVRGARFHFERDRRQFAVTRALVRTVLSRYADIEPHEWRFGKGEFGRPFILNQDAPKLSFNLSHTHGMVVLAVSQFPVMGVDVEDFVQRAAPLDVANAYFSPREVADLTALPLQAQQERFFHYWTLKESYIKAEGRGLNIPLDQFSMLIAQDGAVDIAFHGLPETPNWHFWLMQAKPGVLTALCVRSELTQAPTLVMREGLPTLPERELRPQLVRQSILPARGHT